VRGLSYESRRALSHPRVGAGESLRDLSRAGR
jgi:hypothetical protein